MSYIGMKELEQVPVSPSKGLKGQLSYDNCKGCVSQCEHAGKDRTFCYRGLSCKRAEKIDLVNVVRCKDCKYWVEHDGEMFCHCYANLMTDTAPDDFCSYGERKENVQEDM